MCVCVCIMFMPMRVCMCLTASLRMHNYPKSFVLFSVLKSDQQLCIILLAMLLVLSLLAEQRCQNHHCYTPRPGQGSSMADITISMVPWEGGHF